MDESKIGITERLRAAGRWDEASKFKDEVVKRLRSEGKPAREARERAWVEMAKAYPPVESPEGSATSDFEDVASEQIAALANAPIDHNENVMWTYRHLANPLITPAAAPNLAAWALLRFARADQRLFFNTMLPAAIAKQTKEDHDRKDLAADVDADGEHSNTLSKFMTAMGYGDDK